MMKSEENRILLQSIVVDAFLFGSVFLINLYEVLNPDVSVENVGMGIMFVAGPVFLILLFILDVVGIIQAGKDNQKFLLFSSIGFLFPLLIVFYPLLTLFILIRKMTRRG